MGTISPNSPRVLKQNGLGGQGSLSNGWAGNRSMWVGRRIHYERFSEGMVRGATGLAKLIMKGLTRRGIGLEWPQGVLGRAISSACPKA